MINNLPLKNKWVWCPSRELMTEKYLLFLLFKELCPLMRGRFSLIHPSLRILTFLFRDIIRSWRFTERVYPLCPHTLLGCPLVLDCWDKTTEKWLLCLPRIFPAPCLHAHKPSSLFMSSRMLGILSGHICLWCSGVLAWLELFVKADN